MNQRRTEGFCKGYDGSELYYQTWLTGEPKGTLVITHGISEHSECYQLLAHGLANSGWDIYAWDLRGHGRSDGKRGLVMDFQEYQKDLSAFASFVYDKRSAQIGPLVLLGHSMGGLIAFLTTLEQTLPPIAALCLSSPAFGLTLPVPAHKKYAAQLLARLAPTITLGNEIQYGNLTQDPLILGTYSKDTLRHESVSPRLYLGMVEAFSTAHTKAANFSLPLLMQLSGQDRIVDQAAAEKIFALVSTSKKKIVYNGSYHEIYNDIEREQAYSDLREFLASLETI